MSISKEKLEYLGMFILATNAACYPSKKTVFPSNSNQVSQLLYISIAEIQRFRDRFFFHPRYCSFDRFDEEPSSGVARAER